MLEATARALDDTLMKYQECDGASQKEEMLKAECKEQQRRTRHAEFRGQMYKDEHAESQARWASQRHMIQVEMQDQRKRHESTVRKLENDHFMAEMNFYVSYQGSGE